MAYALDDVAAELIEKMAAAGITATVDPRDVNPPQVWLQLAALDPGYLASTRAYDATWYVHAIVPNVGTGPELALLSDLTDRLLEAGYGITDGETIAVTLPDGADPYPALRFSLLTHVTED